MKLLTKNIILSIPIMLIGINGYAKNSPPAPAQNQVQTLSEPPPSTPIDKNLTILVLAGTLFGFYIIHKHRTNKKRP